MDYPLQNPKKPGLYPSTKRKKRKGAANARKYWEMKRCGNNYVTNTTDTSDTDAGAEHPEKEKSPETDKNQSSDPKLLQTSPDVSAAPHTTSSLEQNNTNNDGRSGHINYWLTDDEIARCIRLFYDFGFVSNDIVIIDPLVSQAMKFNIENNVGAEDHLAALELDQKRHIILPINNSVEVDEGRNNPRQRNSSHWSLLHLDREKGEYCYIDTINNQDGLKLNEIHGRAMADNMNRFLVFYFNDNPNYTFQIFESEIQKNGSDCGLYLLSYVHNFLIEGKYDNATLRQNIDFVLGLLDQRGEARETYDSEKSQEMESADEMADIEELDGMAGTVEMNESDILHEMNEIEEIENTVQKENQSHSASMNSDSQTEENEGEKLLKGSSGRRIVDALFVFEQLAKVECCSVKNIKLQSEHRRGFMSSWLFRCQACGAEHRIYSEPALCPQPPTLENPDLHDRISANTCIVNGILAGGVGFAQLSTLAAAAEIPCMSENTFARYQELLRPRLHEAAQKSMEEARLEAVRLSKLSNNVDQNGRPLRKAHGDCQWSQRSYGTKYTAKSGCGTIIDAETYLILFSGIRTSYCVICIRSLYRKQKPKPHDCGMNWSKSATEMESDIILEGFRKSRETQDLTYNVFIGDGDSNTYSNLVEKKPYEDTTVQKRECVNHLRKNLNKKLLAVRNNSKYPLGVRRLVCDTSAKSDITRHINKAVKHWKKEETTTETDKIDKLKSDILSSPYHVLGNHEKCGKHLCNFLNENHVVLSTVDSTPEAEKCGALREINEAVLYLSHHADSLLDGYTNNICEQFNAVLNKYIGGKRVFHSQRHGYTNRVNAAIISWNSGEILRVMHKITADGESPGFYGKKFIKADQIKRKTTRKRRLNYTKQESKEAQGMLKAGKPDAYYSKAAPLPDPMSGRALRRQMKIKLEEITVTEEDIAQIEAATREQGSSKKWHEERKKRLTASNFGKIVSLRDTTPCFNRVKDVLYYKENFKTPAMAYGSANESAAIEKFCSDYGKSVDKSGLIIDRTYNFLAASPDGIVQGEYATVEVKCPLTAKDVPSMAAYCDSFKKKKNQTCPYVQDGPTWRLREKHEYFYQVQGTLNIANLEKCYFLVYSKFPSGTPWLHVMEIEVDKNLWLHTMVPKLQRFYMTAMLPELADPRYPRRELAQDIRQDLYLQAIAGNYQGADESQDEESDIEQDFEPLP